MLIRSIILLLLFILGALMYLTNFRKSYLQYRAAKAVSSKKVYGNGFSLLRLKLQHFILQHIKLSSDKFEQEAAMMNAAGIKGTPQAYRAETYTNMFIIVIVSSAISLLTATTILLPACAAFCLLYDSRRKKHLSTEFKRIQVEIGKNTAKLCSVINGKLRYMNNVENILKSFYPVANETMQRQLDITIADIRTGNVITALTRLDNRIRLPQLSDICRGLAATHNGDDQRMYFEIKENEFNRDYEALLELEITKRPGKLRKYQFVMVALFLACVFYPFFQYMKQLAVFN